MPESVERVTRAEIIAAARSWVGTPFQHQAAARGVGCDCVGLVRGVAASLSLSTLTDAEWARIGSYGRQPRPDRMGAHLARHLVPTDTPRPGDIAWISWRAGLPMHLAFLGNLGDRLTLIHAVESVGRVVEHGFAPPWPSRVEAWFSIPSLEGAD